MAEVEATIDEDPSKSMSQLAKEMNVWKSTIHGAVKKILAISLSSSGDASC